MACYILPQWAHSVRVLQLSPMLSQFTRTGGGGGDVKIMAF